MAGYIQIYNTLEVSLEALDDWNTVSTQIENWLEDQKEFYWSVENVDYSIELSIRNRGYHELELILKQLQNFYSMCAQLDQDILIWSGVVGYKIVCNDYIEFGAIYVDSPTKTIKSTGFREDTIGNKEDHGKLIQSIMNWK